MQTQTIVCLFCLYTRSLLTLRRAGAVPCRHRQSVFDDMQTPSNAPFLACIMTLPVDI